MRKIKLVGILLGTLLVGSSAFAANSCGTGKCGGEMKKEMDMKKSASCGTGKCGASMKKDMEEMKDSKQNMMENMKDTHKDMKEKMKGSCGTGKCGSK